MSKIRGNLYFFFRNRSFILFLNLKDIKKKYFYRCAILNKILKTFVQIIIYEQELKEQYYKSSSLFKYLSNIIQIIQKRLIFRYIIKIIYYKYSKYSKKCLIIYYNSELNNNNNNLY